MKKNIKNLKITEDDLDTTPNLSTLNYLFGLIGLKDNMDMRIFSRNFIKIDQLLKDALNGILAHIKTLATKTRDGHMSKEDKDKLDGVAENANNYKLPNATPTVVGGIKVGDNLQITSDGILSGPAGYSHPTTSGNKHIPAGGAANYFIKWSSDGIGAWGAIDWSFIQNKPSTYTPTSHTHDDRYFTEGEISEKFKNFCPFPINSVLMLLDNSNPAVLFPSTTWQRQDGRFLQGTSGSEGAGETGGASSVALSIDHLPGHNHPASVSISNGGSHRHQVDNHIHGQPPHTHLLTHYSGYTMNGTGSPYPGHGDVSPRQSNNSNVNSAGGENTGGSAPYTNTTGDHGHGASVSVGYTGGGASFSILPPYLRVNMWRRLT